MLSRWHRTCQVHVQGFTNKQEVAPDAREFHGQQWAESARPPSRSFTPDAI